MFCRNTANFVAALRALSTRASLLVCLLVQKVTRLGLLEAQILSGTCVDLRTGAACVHFWVRHFLKWSNARRKGSTLILSVRMFVQLSWGHTRRRRLATSTLHTVRTKQTNKNKHSKIIDERAGSWSARKTTQEARIY